MDTKSLMPSEGFPKKSLCFPYKNMLVVQNLLSKEAKNRFPFQNERRKVLALSHEFLCFQKLCKSISFKQRKTKQPASKTIDLTIEMLS